MLTLAHGAYTASVNPVGGGLAALAHGTRDLVLRQDGEVGPPRYLGAVLAPWVNRVSDGTYTFDGEDHRLAVSEPERGTALHGLVLTRRWDVAAEEPALVRLTTAVRAGEGYPFALDLEVAYALDDAGLAVTLTATSVDRRPLPFGAGFHPYLLPGGRVDDVTLRFGAGTRCLTDPERLLPTGLAATAGTAYDFSDGRPLGATVLDDAFGDLARDDDGTARVEVGDLRLRADAAWPWLQVFTAPDRRSLAVEACTSPPDAFTTGDGLVVLPPGGRWSGGWGLGVAAEV